MKYFSVLLVAAVIAPLSPSTGAEESHSNNRREERRDDRHDRRDERRDDRNDWRDDRRDDRNDWRDDRRDDRNDWRDDRRDDRHEWRDDRRDDRRDHRNDWNDNDYRPGHPYPRSPTYPYNPGYSSGTYYGDASCSPEVKKKNVSVLEGTVNQLLATEEFADAVLLSDTIKVIQSEKLLEAQIAAYCALVGVDARVPAEIAEFIGARDLAPYAARAQKNLKLSAAQANALVEALSQNLLNNLNN